LFVTKLKMGDGKTTVSTQRTGTVTRTVGVLRVNVTSIANAPVAIQQDAV
jgi:hypothetical protein